MCAAPGSKTAQLIEMIHCEETSALPGNNEILITTNDINNQFTQTLLEFIFLQRVL